MILIDSVYIKDENYYPKVFLEKYNLIEELEIYFYDSYNVGYDEEYFDDSNSDDSDEKILMKKIQMKKN